jgi:hypothetical protein
MTTAHKTIVKKPAKTKVLTVEERLEALETFCRELQILLHPHGIRFPVANEEAGTADEKAPEPLTTVA